MTVRAETQIDLARVDDGSPGTPGTNGATFTPSVDIDGDISWTNDGGLPNPATQNIMGPQGSPGTPGANGVSVTSVEPQYYLSTSSSSATGGSWSSTPPTFVSGYYYWTREYITYSDGSNDTSTEVYDTGMTQAAQDAYDAKTLADDTNQYFWYAPTGNDTGAHITEVPQSEWNDSTDPNYHSGSNILARSTGLAIRDGMDELATFGTNGATIGITDGTQSYLSMDYHSMQMIDRNGNTYFYVSDLRNQSGKCEITDTFDGTGSATVFTLSLPAYSDLVVTVDGVTQTLNTDYTYDGSLTITFTSPPGNGSVIIATYKTTDVKAKAYTVGTRASGSSVGPMSFAEGYDNDASGYISHAEGYNTTASGRYSHAEGYNTTASGSFSHSEGYNTSSTGGSHAEGDAATAIGNWCHAEGDHSNATGHATHAEGQYSISKGIASHAQNWRTIANHYQTAVGKCNIEDATDTYGFIIGNGTADNARSNAFMVDWNGYIYPQATKMDDFVIEKGLYGSWTYRKWKSGRIEAWLKNYSLGSFTPSVWVSPVRYVDTTFALPGVFTSTPTVWVTSSTNQWWIVDANATSKTGGTLRAATMASSSTALTANFYVVQL